MNDYSQTSIIDLAAIIAGHLRNHNIKVVLVGGLAVEIYSENLYLTKDIDMVDTSYTPPKVLNQAMAEIGFSKKGRVYINPTTDICVEFPSAPLSIGDELITDTTVAQVSSGQIPILLARDVVKDRLAAYFHWNDRPSLVQALAVMNKHPIDQQHLETFCRAESRAESIPQLKALQNEVTKRQLKNMSEIESLIVELEIRQL